MREMISAVAVGKMDRTLVVDVDKNEEDFHEGEGPTDIPIAMTSRSNKIVLLQLDGKISVPELRELTKMAKEGCKKINEVQIKALREPGKEIKA